MLLGLEEGVLLQAQGIAPPLAEMGATRFIAHLARLGIPQAKSLSRPVYDDQIRPTTLQYARVKYYSVRLLLITMSDSNLSANPLDPDADLDALLAIAKQAVAKSCNIKPEDVYVDEDGDIDFSSPNSSTVIYVGTDRKPTSLLFRTPLLQDVEDSPEIYPLLNEANIDMLLGQVYYMDGNIWLHYRLVVDRPHPDTIVFILHEMLSWADGYDDKLKSRLGGKRRIEKADDEIEI